MFENFFHREIPHYTTPEVPYKRRLFLHRTARLAGVLSLVAITGCTFAADVIGATANPPRPATVRRPEITREIDRRIAEAEAELGMAIQSFPECSIKDVDYELRALAEGTDSFHSRYQPISETWRQELRRLQLQLTTYIRTQSGQAAALPEKSERAKKLSEIYDDTGNYVNGATHTEPHHEGRAVLAEIVSCFYTKRDTLRLPIVIEELRSAR